MKHDKLFEFVVELIDIQIQKYLSLAIYGVGPDARLNALLVCDEVAELLQAGGLLLKEMKAVVDGACGNSVFLGTAHLMKFYLEQESLRSNAGHLLDDNNIHAGVKGRTAHQLKQLKDIVHDEIDFSIESLPETAVQRQCQYDSNQIARKILNLARIIRENPDIELEPEIPKHAQVALRQNARGRYVILADEIDKLYQKCDQFLMIADSNSGSSELSPQQAKIFEKNHREAFNRLITKFKQIQPDSRLFSSAHQYYRVGQPSLNSADDDIPALSVVPLEKKHSEWSFFSKNRAVTGGVVLGGVLLVSSLLPYFVQLLNQETDNNLRPC